MADSKTEAQGSLPDLVKRYNNYVWQKYVDFEPTTEVDEEEAIETYARYYGEAPKTEKDWEDYFLYGVLLYQAAASDPAREVERLQGARRVIRRYQLHTGDMDLEIVNDTLSDVEDRLQEMGVALEDDEGALLAEAVAAPGVAIAGPPGMILVPEGDFLFGPDRVGRTVEAFWVDKYPVTNREYKVFVEATNYRPPMCWDDTRFNEPDQPVVGVSYMDAQQYAKWAGKTIPSVEQWEKASRGTDGRRYPWGDQEPSVQLANFTPRGNKEGHLEKIGRYPTGASPYGVMDTAGGVWEWTSTNHEEYQDCKIISGGSWVDPEDWIGCAIRLYATPKEKENLLGFRCIKRLE